MFGSALFPPNLNGFSDSIIRNVVQRDSHLHGGRYSEANEISSSHQSPQLSPTRPSPRSPSQQITGHKRPHHDVAKHNTTRAKTQKTKTTVTAEELNAKYAAGYRAPKAAQSGASGAIQDEAAPARGGHGSIDPST
ncbi:unnamed protein product [Phytophthora lilii]|uniref:Unnamed protein product n=1 Tax=Phytophthora lilii TaxID=2077276 RepID=A0A9W6T8R9_9STRA|nr:unnamed protein product [Phytophthora lilii]